MQHGREVGQRRFQIGLGLFRTAGAIAKDTGAEEQRLGMVRIERQRRFRSAIALSNRPRLASSLALARSHFGSSVSSSMAKAASSRARSAFPKA